MEQKNYITSLCSIKNGVVKLNHTTVYTDNSVPTVDVNKSLYKHFQLNYSKFYKMDQLCKLAFVASELLLKNNPITQKYSTEDIAIIISNSSSSLDIDTEHQRTISDAINYYPSPSVFVYTLSNILIGEIAIRNNIKGENTFFIFDKFDADFMSSYVNSLLNSNKAKCCITGWVDFYENNYETFLYSVEKEPGTLKTEHNPVELKNINNN